MGCGHQLCTATSTAYEPLLLVTAPCRLLHKDGGGRRGGGQWGPLQPLRCSAAALRRCKSCFSCTMLQVEGEIRSPTAPPGPHVQSPKDVPAPFHGDRSGLAPVAGHAANYIFA